MAETKQGLKYTKSHEWVKVEGNIAVIGLSDFAQEQLGDLVYAEGIPVDEEVAAGEPIGSVESVKMASDVYTPVSGKVVESNEEIEDESEQINEKPYETWFVKLEMSNPAELDALMDADAYEKFCEEEA